MILFPAIDLKDGHCVRLERGAMESATVFNADPAAQAKEFAAAGFEWLHCVDLNGAFDGRSTNADAIKAIRAAIRLPIQLGGGIRDMAGIEGWLAAGITRVILGTAALKNPALVKTAAHKFPGKIAVGIDARDGMLGGVNAEATAALARAVRIPVIASGGVAGIEDIQNLKAANESNILGVIIGRALYDGRIDPKAALDLANKR